MLIWLATSTSLACGEPSPGLHAQKAVGWTTDSRYFVFEYELITLDGDSKQLTGALDTLTDKIAPISLAEWRAEHPLAPLDAGASCGSASIVRSVEELGGFSGPRGVWRSGDGVVGSMWLTLGAASGGARWVHAELDNVFSLNVHHAWSPDCRQVGWILGGYEPRGSAIGPYRPRSSVLVGKVGPSIHVMAHPNARDAVDPLVRAASQAGFSPHIGPAALQDRDKTVIYTAAASRADAERLSKVIPGGASIEALTWSTPADIVVAAGRSAAGAK